MNQRFVTVIIYVRAETHTRAGSVFALPLSLSLTL